ncbi:MAG: protoporphyrinogen oxidase, partial [Candidatus Limnocylindria bacterium]|nr:protoporphyrinogen oxidase [Candidatus Limnocylindria bacterium]
GGESGDEAVGAFLRRRFGDVLVERLASPLLEAVYGTPVDELSLLALLPHLREAERRHGSLLRAAVAQRPSPRAERAPGPQTLTLAGGMGSLVDALVERIENTEILLDTAVVRLERSEPGYRALLGDGSRLSVSAVIVATPPRSAAPLLAEVAPGAASALADIPYGSTAVVSLGYREDQLARPLAGHGFLVPPGALAISACTWSSSKWPGRAPDGCVLLRASVREPRLLAADDASLIEAVHAALASALGIRGRHGLARVARHLGVMPRYTVGHLERIAAIDAALADQPAIKVIGAAYRGVGIPECIAQGQSAAEALGALAVAA